MIMAGVKSVELFKKVYSAEEDFPDDRPQVAFVGRSNVGKSTLLNSIFNRRMAETSSTPGKTRTLDFYLVNGKFYIVDLPGYGYMKISKKEQRRIAKLVEHYLKSSTKLEYIFILMDARHPAQKKDAELLEYLNFFRLHKAVVLTKIDKLPRSRRREIFTEHERFLRTFGEYTLFPTSAVTREGLKELVNFIFLIIKG